jgi:hypothetical protein
MGDTLLRVEPMSPVMLGAGVRAMSGTSAGSAVSGRLMRSVAADADDAVTVESESVAAVPVARRCTPGDVGDVADDGLEESASEKAEVSAAVTRDGVNGLYGADSACVASLSRSSVDLFPARGARTADGAASALSGFAIEAVGSADVSAEVGSTAAAAAAARVTPGMRPALGGSAGEATVDGVLV